MRLQDLIGESFGSGDCVGDAIVARKTVEAGMDIGRMIADHFRNVRHQMFHRCPLGYNDRYSVPKVATVCFENGSVMADVFKLFFVQYIHDVSPFLVVVVVKINV